MSKKEKYETGEAVIKIGHLYKSFGDKKVLDDFNLTVYRGENIAILGKSGSGKSVLIKCLIRLIDPDKGEIEIFGKNTADLQENELNEMRTKIGFLFQSSALYDSMTVRENLEFALRRAPVEIKESNAGELVKEALESVGLENTADLMPSELSGGMRKRIGIARTIIMHPEIILYDEPTSGLDPITGKEINKLIVEVQQKYDATSIIITHDLTCVQQTANRVVILMDGKCYAEGTYDEFMKSEDKIIKQFFS